MRHLLLAFALLLSFFAGAQAQSDNTTISILTCSTGEELYASFGHTGLRVKNAEQNIDEVYNYGIFDFGDPNFYSKFTRGKLLYYIGTESFTDFMSTYQYEQRSVKEQILNLDSTQKQSILAYLNNNLKPENRSYKYDFLYDNCATRVRDIFPKTLGNDFKFGAILNGKTVTFRAILNSYLSRNHWSRLGINLLLASPIDKAMTDEETMFLPDMLFTGLGGATLKGQKIVQATQELLPAAPKSAPSVNQPLWAMMGLLLIVLLVFFIRPLQRFKNALAFLLLLLSGALGCFLLFMWFGTDHKSCANNYNILWAFPLHLIVAFTVFKARRWHKNYSLLAIGLMMTAMIVHIFGIQVMPLIELLPFFFCLMYIYVYMYKRSLSVSRK